MSDKPENQAAETEKGFGTGLRAQLQRRQGEEAQGEAIEAEHARVADLQAELAAEQQLAAEEQQHAETRLREVERADRDRDKARAEVAKMESALADRLKKVEKKESELATRERAADM